MADIASAVNKMLTSDHEKNLSDTIKSTITSRSHNCCKSFLKKYNHVSKTLWYPCLIYSERIDPLFEAGNQDPEMTLLQVSSNLQDQINSTSPKELFKHVSRDRRFFSELTIEQESLWKEKSFPIRLKKERLGRTLWDQNGIKPFPAGTNDP